MRKVLHIPWDTEGIFLERENRFLSTVEVDGRCIYAHIHDPGRLKELLRPGVRVFLRKVDSPKRKTSFDVLAVERGDGLVFIHSGYHRKISEFILMDPSMSPFGPIGSLRAEVPFGRSRIDFLIEVGGFSILVEVKGCTLERDGVALFPDAPTIRGKRHVEELGCFVSSGGRASVIFLVFVPSARFFSPNVEEDPGFSQALVSAVNQGLEVFPLRISYKKDGSLYFAGRMPFVIPEGMDA